MHSSTKIVQIAATCLFNEGISLLQIMQIIEIAAEANAHRYVTIEDKHRIVKAMCTAQEVTKEVRLRRKQIKIHKLLASSSAEGLLYGPE